MFKTLDHQTLSSTKGGTILLPLITMAISNLVTGSSDFSFGGGKFGGGGAGGNW